MTLSRRVFILGAVATVTVLPTEPLFAAPALPLFWIKVTLLSASSMRLDVGSSAETERWSTVLNRRASFAWHAVDNFVPLADGGRVFQWMASDAACVALWFDPEGTARSQITDGNTPLILHSSYEGALVNPCIEGACRV